MANTKDRVPAGISEFEKRVAFLDLQEAQEAIDNRNAWRAEEKILHAMKTLGMIDDQS